MSISVASLWSRGGKMVRVVRLKPFDQSTEDGRSQERFRRVALTALASMAARAINLAILIISVPLTLHYLGTERYGLWMTITSFTTLLGFADLGMGIGVQNAVSRADGTGDKLTAQKYVSSGFFMLLALSVSLILFFAAVYHAVHWAQLLNVKSPRAMIEAGPTMAVFASCFACNIVFGIVQRVQLGYQEGFNSNLWQCFASILGLGFLLLALHFRAGLPYLVLAAVGTPIFGLACNGIWFFSLRQPWLRPSWSRLSLQTCQQLFRVGLAFLILQIGFAFAFSSDNLIISHTLGAQRVAEYSVCVRLFSVITLLIGFSTAPLWPAYTEAHARGNTEWLRQTVKKSARFSFLIAALCSTLLALFGQKIIHLWAGHAVVPSLKLLWGMAFWVTLDVVRLTFSNFLAAINLLRFQCYTLIIFAVVSLTLKVLLGRVFGLEGIIWIGVTTYLIIYIIPSIIYAQKVLREMPKVRLAEVTQ